MMNLTCKVTATAESAYPGVFEVTDACPMGTVNVSLRQIYDKSNPKTDEQLDVAMSVEEAEQLIEALKVIIERRRVA